MGTYSQHSFRLILSIGYVFFFSFMMACSEPDDVSPQIPDETPKCQVDNSNAPGGDNPAPGNDDVPAFVHIDTFVYPPDLTIHPSGKEVIYSFLDEGNIEIANDLLNDIWALPRYEDRPVELKDIIWTENPHGEKYWRFIFYSLRHTRHLLSAYLETGEQAYAAKLEEIINSFYERGLDSPYVSDAHTSAFLVMVLTNTFWKLAAHQQLSLELAHKIQCLVHDRMHFLEDPANFESHNNHGVTEAAALLLGATVFPNFEESQGWAQLGRERLVEMIYYFVDEDGIQIEQSPFYHFYTLQFFWDVVHWADVHNVELSPQARERVDKMIDFGTYIAQPDLMVPMLGASQRVNVARSFSPVLQNIGQLYPHLRFVQTLGEQGVQPPYLDRLFPVGGFSILRSGYFGPVDEESGQRVPFHRAKSYRDQLHIVFDVGPYRTGHSHYDALHVHLYAHGKLLLADSGLFTLERPEKYAYYKSTRAHNTVVVNGEDQPQGTAIASALRTGEGWAYQSAYHDLYEDVIHRRGLVRLGSDLVVVVDELVSTANNATHNFEQTWNFTPHANVEENDGFVSVLFDDAGEWMRIYQAGASPFVVNKVKGQDDPIDGWYSERYHEEDPAYALKYKHEGSSAQFITVFSLGPNATRELSMSATTQDGVLNIQICAEDEQATISLINVGQPEDEIEVIPSAEGCL